MRTINPQIDIFESYEKAMKAFNKSTVPCQLLESSFGRIPTWFVDRSKEAIKEWPQHYKLISEKD